MDVVDKLINGITKAGTLLLVISLILAQNWFFLIVFAILYLLSLSKKENISKIASTIIFIFSILTYGFALFIAINSKFYEMTVILILLVIALSYLDKVFDFWRDITTPNYKKGKVFF